MLGDVCEIAGMVNVLVIHCAALCLWGPHCARVGERRRKFIRRGVEIGENVGAAAARVPWPKSRLRDASAKSN
jgi:hypothetical protein